MPKQLLPLAGGDEPLIAATARRLDPLVPVERIWVSTGASLVAATAAALPRIPVEHILAEPVARNTAPAIGWATATIARADPDAIVAVFPADHFVGDGRAFLEVVERAARVAEGGWITTVGIVPTRPETGFGYIEVGEAIAGGAHLVARFVEKPDRERASAFVTGGKHLWNGGMFFFRASTMRDAIAEHMPALAAGLEQIAEGAARGRESQAVADVFPTLPSVSIDYGVMEKARRVAVVPGRFGWSDVGDWQATWEKGARDGQGNVLPADAIAIDARNNLVMDLASEAGSRTWALVGVHDLVVVETDDAVLVIPRERAQDVRLVVEALSSSGRTSRL